MFQGQQRRRNFLHNSKLSINPVTVHAKFDNRDDVTELRTRLTSNLALLNAFNGALALGISHTTKIGVDRLVIHQDKQEQQAIMEWLTATNFPAQQSDIVRGCQEGTGKWLLNSEEFRSWLYNTAPTLFCPGIPGAGKTMMTAVVVEYLQTCSQGAHDVGIAYVYCNYKAEQTIEDLVASLLKQLLQGRDRLHKFVAKLHQVHARKGTRPSVDEVLEAIEAVVREYQRVFILIDALDECAPAVRSRLLQVVAAMQAHLGHQSVSLFATSRLVPEIMGQFDGGLSLSIRAADEDVGRFLEDHMANELPSFVRRSPPLQAAIKTAITDAVDGM